MFSNKQYYVHSNAASVIQRHYKTYTKAKNYEKSKLLDSINNTLNNNTFDIISLDSEGNTMVLKETVLKYDFFCFEQEHKFYLQERKRIKERSNMYAI